MQDYVLQSQYDKEVGNYDNVRTITDRLNDIEWELNPEEQDSLADEVHKLKVALNSYCYDILRLILSAREDSRIDENGSTTGDIVNDYFGSIVGVLNADYGVDSLLTATKKMVDEKPTEKPEYKLPYTATELVEKLGKI